jgi:hypothetical protein
VTYGRPAERSRSLKRRSSAVVGPGVGRLLLASVSRFEHDAPGMDDLDQPGGSTRRACFTRRLRASARIRSTRSSLVRSERPITRLADARLWHEGRSESRDRNRRSVRVTRALTAEADQRGVAADHPSRGCGARPPARPPHRDVAMLDLHRRRASAARRSSASASCRHAMSSARSKAASMSASSAPDAASSSPRSRCRSDSK